MADLFRSGDTSPRHRGKIGIAPCGHEGEHLSVNYIKCLRNCDCIHRERHVYEGREFCYNCGNFLRWVSVSDAGDADDG